MKFVSKIKNILCNLYINQVFDRNFTILKDLYINNRIKIIEKILIRKERKKVVKQKS